MYHKITLLFATALCSLFTAVNPIFAQSTVFTYQGRLVVGGNPSTNGVYDFQFQIFDTDGSSSNGSSYGTPNPNNINGVGVTNGFFTVLLNFGNGLPLVFDGNSRWLKISVRTNGNGTFIPLSPRQPITPAPYAIYSGNAAQLGGQSSTAYVAKMGDTMTGTLHLPVDGLVMGGNQFVASSGNVGVGTTTPSAQLEVVNGDSKVALNPGIAGVLPGGTIGLSRPDGVGTYTSLFGVSESTSEDLVLFGSGGGSELRLVSGGGGSTGFGFYLNTPVTAAFGNSRPTTNIAVKIDGSGYVGIGTATPACQLDIRSADTAQLQLISTNAGYGSTIVLQNTRASGAANLGAINFLNSNGNLIPGQIVYRTDDTINFRVGSQDRMQIHADGTVNVPILEIDGADMAEPFKLSDLHLPKGSVVVIDERNPGQLKLSNRQYDKHVAGILSGANGVHPGIRLTQQGFNDGGEAVALSGRAYALADASYAAILPGDLLTTSDTPGHCMKVTRHGKAQGAIIGKAMSSLAKGKGMVLVLVSLQ